MLFVVINQEKGKRESYLEGEPLKVNRISAAVVLDVACENGSKEVLRESKARNRLVNL